ncbi:hypothetical protein MKZ38_008754 [Zalerion maritima]|uniref:Protein kinase domain-containing protein n=1 Tax=Zalerion maritima TaxID=339359 RepID=A0AAD5RGG4_9PEZI|nr:hypothetical protein MKZ38_008754 [Zalerion maritima]
MLPSLRWIRGRNPLPPDPEHRQLLDHDNNSTSDLSLDRIDHETAPSNNAGLVSNTPENHVLPSLETLQYTATIVNLRLPLVDTVPGLDEPQTSKIGEGGEAIALSFEPFDLRRPNQSSKLVAWKVRSKSTTCKEVLNETITLGLAKDHRNIVQILGIAFSSPDLKPVILMEYSATGNLETLVNTRPDYLDSLPLRLSFARDIGRGILSLHNIGVVWGDPKPKNVLVFPYDGPMSRFILKLADFGDSRTPASFWCTREFPRGEADDGWVSPYSMFWHCRDDNSTDAFVNQQYHQSQCFHFDTFVFGRMVLWILVEQELRCNLPITADNLRSKGAGMEWKEKIDTQDFASASWSLLQESLYRRQQEHRRNRGVSKSDEDRLKEFFRLTLSWDPCSCISKPLCLVERCLPPSTEKSPTPTSRVLEDISSSLELPDIISYLRQRLATRQLEAALVGCFRDAQRQLTSELIEPLLPAGLHKLVDHQSQPPSLNTMDAPLHVNQTEDIHDLARNLHAARLTHIAKTSSTATDYSSLDGNGLAPIAYAIMGDDPGLEAARHRTHGLKCHSEQLSTIHFFLDQVSASTSCSMDSDTIHIWAARHATHEVLCHIFGHETTKVTPEVLRCASVAQDGSRWTTLRAAMIREGEFDIFQYILDETASALQWQDEGHSAAVFEKQYNYLHLCAFLSAGWSVKVAKALLEKDSSLSTRLARDDEEGLELTPFALAACHGNMELANFLLSCNPEVAYVSVIPPAILPPPSVSGWHEASIIPSEAQFTSRFSRMAGKLPRIGKFCSNVGELAALIPGQFTRNQLAKELHDNSSCRSWVTVSGCRQRRITYKFLLEFGLEAGFRGPFMYKWLVYRSPLDHVLLTGKRHTAKRLIQLLVSRGLRRIVERALGEALRQILFHQRNLDKDLSGLISDNQNAVDQALRHSVTDMVLQLAVDERGASQLLDFVARDIYLDDNTRPDSFFEDGRFVFGMPPDRITSLLHMAVFGGLYGLVSKLSPGNTPQKPDGGGRTPRRLAEDELASEKRKLKNDSGNASMARQQALEHIISHFDSTQPEWWRPSWRPSASPFITNTTMWATVVMLIQISSLYIMWSFDNDLCNLLVVLIYKVAWFFLSVIGLVVFVAKMLTGFGHAFFASVYYRDSRRMVGMLLLCWPLALATLMVLFQLLTYLLPLTACRHAGWVWQIISFVVALLLLTLSTIFVLKIPRLVKAFLLSARRAELSHFLS